MEVQTENFIAHHLSITNIVAALAAYLVLSIVTSFWRAPVYPSSIPWVGHGSGWLAALPNVFGSFTKSRQWTLNGYNEYSKNGKTFVLPSTLGGQAEIVIPRLQMQWMIDQPDNVLSTSAAHYDILHGDHSFAHPIMLKDPYHEHVVHKNLARNLSAVIPEMNDEVCQAIDEMFGTEPDWRNVNVLDTLMRMVPKITNRMLVGEPLCRNRDYLENMLAFTMDVIRGMMMFALVPKLLSSFIGAIAGLAPKYHYWRQSKHSLPLIKKRLADIGKKHAGDSEYKDWQPPNDFITWTIKTATAEGRQDELEPGRIAMRLMPLNFASIHTTAMTGHSVLLDILSADPSVVQSLREEAARVLQEENNRFTKEGLSRMYKLDSAIRESQRYSSFALTFVHRKVLPREGIISPEGIHCAQGTIISCPWAGVSGDGDLHDDADEYDAFRYSRVREAFEGTAREERNQAEALKMKQTGIVTTSDKHFAFGHGRHACPGRFFVSYEIKMIVAYLVLNYDIKHLPERPQAIWVGRNMVPPSSACIEVKRRVRQ